MVEEEKVDGKLLKLNRSINTYFYVNDKKQNFSTLKLKLWEFISVDRRIRHCREAIKNRVTTSNKCY